MSEIKCTKCEKSISAEAYLSPRLHAERVNIERKGVCFSCERHAAVAAKKLAQREKNISLTAAQLREVNQKHIGKTVCITGRGTKKIVASFPTIYTKVVHGVVVVVPSKIRVSRGEKVTIVGVESDNFFTVRKANGSTVSLPRMNLELTK